MSAAACPIPTVALPYWNNTVHVNTCHEGEKEWENKADKRKERRVNIKSVLELTEELELLRLIAFSMFNPTAISQLGP